MGQPNTGEGTGSKAQGRRVSLQGTVDIHGRARKQGRQQALAEQIVIDLKQFSRKQAGSVNLLGDLIQDARREGVRSDEKRHGPNQPRALRELLKAHDLANVAKQVRSTKGMITLRIPYERIRTE